MEEAWQDKCSSGWLAQPAFPPASSESSNQMNMNAQQFYHPAMMHATNLGDTHMLHEPGLPHLFNTDLGKSGNSETGNSFLGLLSGNSNHLCGELLHSPNTRSQLVKFPLPNGETVRQSTSQSFSAYHIPPLSKFHCSDTIFNGDFSSFNASRPSVPTISKSSDVLTDLQPPRGSPKADSKRSTEDVIRGMEMPFKRCGLLPLSSSSIQHQNNQTSHNAPSDANVHGLALPTSIFRGRPRVSCLNTTGELFLNDMGLLGVLCSCHCLPMSVAKFCQHSGLTSANPSEAIRLESGMTLAQWCKMCFGNLTSGDCNGSDPSKYSSVEQCSVGSKASSFHSLSKKFGTINPVEAFVGLGRSSQFSKNLQNARRPNMAVHANIEKPVQNDLNYGGEKKNSVVNGLHRTGITCLAQASMPVISENNVLQAEFMNLKRLHSTPKRQEPNAVSQLFSMANPGNSQASMPMISENNNLQAEFMKMKRLHLTPKRREPNTLSQLFSNANYGNTSVSYAHLGPKNFFSLDKNNFTQPHSSNEAFIVGTRDGSDLRLGQPSPHEHTSVSFFSTSTCLPEVQQQNLSDRCNLPDECVRDAKRPRLNQSYPLMGSSSLDRRSRHTECSTTTSALNIEPEDLLTYANKDSSVSLFLSHLTGGTGLFDASNKSYDGLNSSIHYDSISPRESVSLHTRNAINEPGKTFSLNESDYFKDKGNTFNVITDNCSNIVGSSEINGTQIEGRRITPAFVPEQCLRPCSVGLGKPSLLSSQPLRNLRMQPNGKNTNEFGGMPIIEEGCRRNNVIHGSEIRASHWTDLPCCPNPETILSHSGHDSEASCLSCKQNKNFSDHVKKGNLKVLASAVHESLVDEQEQLSGSFKMKQHGRLCCLSAMNPHNNPCSDDFMKPKNVTYCNIHQNPTDSDSLPYCYYNNHFAASHCKCSSEDSYKCCSNSASAGTTACPKCSPYHVNGTNRHICFRPRNIPINTSSDNVQHGTCIYKMGDLSLSGNCCCNIISKCQADCCFGRAVSTSDTTNNSNVNDIMKRINTTFDEQTTFQKERMVGLDQCKCFKKTSAIQNNCQTGLWRDAASNKIAGYSATTDKHAKTLEAPRVDRPTEIALKNPDATFEIPHASLDERQTSDRSSSSAPAITEVSVEVNKRDAKVSNAKSTMILNCSDFDEGSGIEKCSSSDEMPETGKCKKVPDTNCKVLASNSAPHCISSSSSTNIVSELDFRNSSNQKCERNKITTRCTNQNFFCGKPYDKSESHKLNETVPKSVILHEQPEPLQSIDEVNCILSSKRDAVSFQPENVVESAGMLSSGPLNIKRKRSDFPSSKFKSLKKLEKQNLQLTSNENLSSNYSDSIAEKANLSFHEKRSSFRCLNHLNDEKPPKYMSLSCIVRSMNHEAEDSTVKKRPIVSGNSGIIACGEVNALQKPVKIVPLKLILRKARICKSNSEAEPKTSLFSKPEFADVKDQQCSELSSGKSMDAGENLYLGSSEVGSVKLFMSDSESWMPKLDFGKTIKGRYASISSRSHFENNKANNGEQWKMNRRSELCPVDAEALCCVCGSSNKEEINCLLQCNRCMIRVHQACYGVSKFPKDVWYCRPCKTKSQNIACVLCGYDGGAMTQALRSTIIVKSLLQVWGIITESSSRKYIWPSESTKDIDSTPCSLQWGETNYDGFSFLPGAGSRNSRAIPEATIQENSCLANEVNTNNSIIQGKFDPSVRQWVHVVCGLWTPGTRCPNVDTMHAFDVSGAIFATSKNIVCSICSRPGGSCIKCRVSNCLIYFHPWCAHQNGLLQSEIEGENNEKVGFYGKCIVHARYNYHLTDCQPLNVEALSCKLKERACARTEGFRGRGRGFFTNYQKPFNGGDGCIVSQVQINVWLHINGQKSCMKGVKAAACSEVEHDLRKEYIRYKLSKGWKHLVVYKSGIHALGLYTSQFIAQGAMVVEYVGEIVGLRVADKREIEYQSGGRLQCKSACYFFRIDKEHIIDATRKGGIARFVNHSCLPNCVAKIISIKNEKKVVFFAERDINPGEEITYDYHFNREDEGKKIPCFCNSKNCRRYLN